MEALSWLSLCIWSLYLYDFPFASECLPFHTMTTEEENEEQQLLTVSTMRMWMKKNMKTSLCFEPVAEDDNPSSSISRSTWSLTRLSQLRSVWNHWNWWSSYKASHSSCGLVPFSGFQETVDPLDRVGYTSTSLCTPISVLCVYCRSLGSLFFDTRGVVRRRILSMMSKPQYLWRIRNLRFGTLH